MEFMEIIDGFGTVELSIMLAAGLVVLLFGYRIKKVAFFVAWFLLGYLGVTFLMPTITQMLPEVASTELYRTLIPIAGGLLLALLGFSIEKICVSGICFVLVMLVTAQNFGTDMQTLAISAVVGIIASGLVVTAMKPATIIATAGVGAYAIMLALLKLVDNIDLTTYYWPVLIGMVAMGAIFQFLTTKRVK